MIWAGSPFAERIEFNTGAPVGAVSYQLLGNDGAPLIEDTLTPDPGALSCLIIIPGTENTCDLPYFENRTLTFSYVNADGLVTGRSPYRVQRPIPFVVGEDSVRAKLGVEKHELPNDNIDLVAAYIEFAAYFEEGALATHANAGTRATMLCSQAIEAMAALVVLPSLQLKIAQRESSGTNEYQRFAGTDWSSIEASLAAHIDRARAAVDGLFDTTGDGAFSFGTVTRTDAITGA